MGRQISNRSTLLNFDGSFIGGWNGCKAYLMSWHGDKGVKIVGAIKDTIGNRGPNVFDVAKWLKNSFGPFADWDACMGHMVTKGGYDSETAKQVCGRMKADMENCMSGGKSLAGQLSMGNEMATKPQRETYQDTSGGPKDSGELENAWSDEARAASLEARRSGANQSTQRADKLGAQADKQNTAAAHQIAFKEHAAAAQLHQSLAREYKAAGNTTEQRTHEAMAAQHEHQRQLHFSKGQALFGKNSGRLESLSGGGVEKKVATMKNDTPPSLTGEQGSLMNTPVPPDHRKAIAGKMGHDYFSVGHHSVMKNGEHLYVVNNLGHGGGQAHFTVKPGAQELGNRANPDAMRVNIGSNCTLINRVNDGGKFEIPKDGWFHLAPMGEFIHPETGLMQVLDNRACEAMVTAFQGERTANANFPGLLVDFDHFSNDVDKSSEAAAWIEDLQNREDGLWGKLRFSDVGQQAVEGGRYRMVSPVWKLAQCEQLQNGRVRPLRLDRVALTNDPNLKGLTPLSNRSLPGGNVAANQNTTGTKTMDYKAQLLALLGLPQEATDEQIQAAIQGSAENRSTADAAVEELEVAKNRVTELETMNNKFLSEQVERDLVEFAPVISDKEAIKTQLMANRDGTVAFLKGLKKPEAPVVPAKKPLFNRGNQEVPPTPVTGEQNNGKLSEAQSKRISNRAQQIVREQKLPFARAFETAKQEVMSAAN